MVPAGREAVALPGASATILAAARLSREVKPRRALAHARTHVGAWEIGTLAVLASLLAGLWFLGLGLIPALSEAQANLLLARRTVEGLPISSSPLVSSGLPLPLPQALLTALSFNDFLSSSALAGSVFSMAAYVLACVCLYKLVFDLTDLRLAALTAVLFFSGPNVLYLQATALPTMIFLALMCAFFYFFARWVQKPRALRNLLASAVVLMLATLSSYVGWALLAGALVVVVITLAANHFRAKEALLYFAAFATLASLGVIGWLGANQVLFGDWLHFARFQALPASSLSFEHLQQALTLYAVTAWQSVGVLAALVATLGLLFWLLAKLPGPIRLTGLLFLIPFPFCVTLLTFGALSIQVPLLAPGHYLNTAWGTLMAPACGFFAGCLAARLQAPGWASAEARPGRASRLAARTQLILRDRPLLALPALGLLSAVIVCLQGPLTVGEAQANFSSPSGQAQLQAGQWLRAHYSGGLILLQQSGNSSATFTSQIPLVAIVSETDSSRFEASLKDPLGAHITWIFMRTAPDGSSPDQVWQALHDSTVLVRSYYLAYQSGGVEIYVRSPGQ